MTTKKKITKEKTIKKQSIVNEEKSKKPKIKKYLILGLIYLITGILVFLLRYWYISYQNYQLTIPVLKDTLKEVTILELDHYITANPDAVIYIEVSEDENSRQVANDLKDLIKEKNLANKVVYLNISSVADKEKFLNDFSKKYIEKNKLNHYPALVLFLDGKVDDFVAKTDKQSLNIGDVAQLFEQYELEGDN